MLEARGVAESKDIRSSISLDPQIRSTYTCAELKDNGFNSSPNSLVLELNMKLSPKTLGYHPTFALFKHGFRQK